MTDPRCAECGGNIDTWHTAFTEIHVQGAVWKTHAGHCESEFLRRAGRKAKIVGQPVPGEIAARYGQ